MNQYIKSNKLNKLVSMNPIQKELEYFLLCADAGSLLRAAEKLDVQQAGLSKMMQKLESDLGEKVFYRRSRGIELTEFGKQLYQVLIKTKSYWNENFSMALNESHGLSGKLKIGFHQTLASDTLPLFLPKLMDAFPQLQLEYVLNTSLETTRKVAALEIDLGIVMNPIKNNELIVRPIKTEIVGVWKSKKSEAKVLVHNPDMYMSQKYLKKFSTYKMVPMQDYEVIGNLVKNTDFLGVLPQSVAERYQLEQVGEPVMTVQFALIWHKDKFADKNRYQIIELMLKSLKK